MTPDNRALWELVEKAAYELEEAALAARAPELRAMMDIARKLRDAVEHTVVVRDEDVERAVDASNAAEIPVWTDYRDVQRAKTRAALESMARGKS